VPWTVAELVFHVQVGMRRLTGMLTSPEPAGSGLMPAAGYFRADQRFSAATNADRVSSAQQGAAALADAVARARAFEQTRQQAWDLVRAAPPGRAVRTRHGDRMLLTEWLRGEAGWDRVSLVATLTGRRPASAAEAQLIQRIGGQRLILG
jgi:hypothetical protein